MQSKLFFIALLLSVLLSCSQDDPMSSTAEADRDFALELVQSFQWGGSQDDALTAIIANRNGLFTMLGHTASIDGDINTKNRPGNDYWMLQASPQGFVQHNRTYGGSGDDIGTALLETEAGNLVLAGYSQSADGDASRNAGFHDHWFLEVNASAEVNWERSYGFAGHDHAYSIVQTQDGGLFTAGFLDVTASEGQGNETVSAKHGVGEFWGQKLDAAGNLEWRRYFGGSNNDRAYKVLQAPDGGFVLFGLSESEDFDISDSKGTYDFWVIKISATGDLLWERNYGGSEIDRAYAATAAPDGGYLIAGQSFSADGDKNTHLGNSDAWLIKINGQGELLWEHSYGGSEFDYAAGIAPLGNDFMVVGNSRSTDGDLSNNSGENDLWIYRIDATGELLWSASYGGSGIDQATDVAVLPDGTVGVTGFLGNDALPGTSAHGGQDAVLLIFQ
ncbi:hypothetical protein [Croceiramulus getboli]|nr:hypothetical protein P8624_05615 [Flavobacteriaceae bacterium YJPT1-3]